MYISNKRQYICMYVFDIELSFIVSAICTSSKISGRIQPVSWGQVLSTFFYFLKVAQSDELWVYVSVRRCMFKCVCECGTNVAVKVLLSNALSLMRLPNEFHFISYVYLSLEVKFKCPSQNLFNFKLNAS